jgi:hypothetical protein
MMSRHSVSELGDEGMEARDSTKHEASHAAAEDNTGTSRMPISSWRTICGDVDVTTLCGHVDVTTYNVDVGSRAAASPSAGLARNITDLDALLGMQSPPAALARNITDVASSPLGAMHVPSSSKLICSPVRTSSPGVHTSSRLKSPHARVSSPLVRVGSPLAGSFREARRECAMSLREASPIRKTREASPIRNTFSRLEFAKTSHALRRQSETSIRLIMQLRRTLVRQLDTSENVLAKGTQMIQECGQAIATWFGALSGPALEAAIKEAFEKFDADRSGMIDQQEFEKAMATLGLRLTADEYSELFEKCDADKSGEIDSDEFMHMIKCHLKKACKDTCPVCLGDSGSNLLRAYLRKRWADDDSRWAPAASTLQAFTNAKLVHASYAPVVQEKAPAGTLQAFVASEATRYKKIGTIQEDRQKKLPTPPPVSVHAEFEARWDQDESKWAPAASTLKVFVRTQSSHASYAQVVQEKINEEVAEDALEATTAAIMQQVFIEAQEVVVQEAIEEVVAAAAEEEVVVVPRTCGAYTWDFRKDIFPSAKPIRTRTHPFIRRYGHFTAANSARAGQIPPLSPSDFSYHYFSSTSSMSLPMNPSIWTSTSDPSSFGGRQASASFSPTRRNIPTAMPRSYPSPPTSERAALRSPGWSTSPLTRRRNETARSSFGALTDRRGLRTETSVLLNSTAKAHAGFFPCEIHWEKCTKIEERLRKLTKLRYASNSRSLVLL